MMPERRILILTTSYLPLVGGSELAIASIAERLPDYRFDVVTARLEPELPRHEQRGNIEVFRVGNQATAARFLLPKNFLPLALAWRAWRLTCRRRYLAVHAYQASQAAGAAWLLSFMRPGLPFVLTLQEGKNLARQPLLLRMFRWIILRRVDVFTAISEHLRSYLRARRPHSRVELIPNGVDVERFDAPINPPERELIRASWGVRSGERVIMSASRLVPKNGIADLIEAVALLAEPTRLVLIGDGPLHGELAALAEQRGIADRVVFLGTVPPSDLPRLLSSADVFARPSLSEGLGSAFLEAMAAGLPTVGTTVGGITDFLRDGDTGFLCEAGNSMSIATALRRALEDTPHTREIANRGHELVRERYTWDRVAERMAAVYASLEPIS